MVQSVELVVDGGLDALVREEWQLLRDAGLPSQARHTGVSNAPHVTVGVAASIDERAEVALGRVDYRDGALIRLGGLLVFAGRGAGRGAVLARAVVPSARLLTTHLAVDAALDGMPGRPDTTLPGRWMPHVTLARRLDADQLAAALDVLADRAAELEGEIRCARRWDGDARATWDLAPTA